MFEKIYHLNIFYIKDIFFKLRKFENFENFEIKNFEIQMISTKKSFGLVCCRWNHSMEILMVKKRYTFYYVEFVLGHYQAQSDEQLLFLFNRMSNEEKIEIESMDFNRIWYKIWMESSHDLMPNSSEFKTYHRCKKKFENAFIRNFTGDINFIPGERLRDLLSKSHNQDTMWEIPKGKKAHPQETDLECAIRETIEETGITNGFTILPELDPLEIRYKNQKAHFINKYFICLETSPNSMKLDYNPKYKKSRINFRDKRQILEIVDVKWMNLDELRRLDQTGRFTDLAERLFKLIKTRYKLSKIKKYEY